MAPPAAFQVKRRRHQNARAPLAGETSTGRRGQADDRRQVDGAGAAEPPPDTATWFVTCEGASAATFTVTVMGG